MRPMAEAVVAPHCPGCGQTARRTFGSPGLRTLNPRLRRALDASAGSADNPTLVSGVPGRSPRATLITRDPRHAKLPRP